MFSWKTRNFLRDTELVSYKLSMYSKITLGDTLGTAMYLC